MKARGAAAIAFRLQGMIGLMRPPNAVAQRHIAQHFVFSA